MLHQRLVQIVSGWVAFCHLVLGAAGVLAGAPLMAWMIATFYGARVTIDPTLFYVVKLVSVYYLAFGALAAAIMLRPRRYVSLVPIVVMFFVIRSAELVYFSRLVSEELHVPDNRITEKIVSFACIAAVLGYSGHRLRRSLAATAVGPR
jgi:hypothetical protein